MGIGDKRIMDVIISDGVKKYTFYNIPKRLAKAIILLLNYCENGDENIISAVEEEHEN